MNKGGKPISLIGLIGLRKCVCMCVVHCLHTDVNKVETKLTDHICVLILTLYPRLISPLYFGESHR